MFLTEEQAKARLNSGRNLANLFSLEKTSEAQEDARDQNSPDRAQPRPFEPPEVSKIEKAETRTFTVEEHILSLSGKNRTNLSRETRNEIALRARLGEKTSALAAEFQITQGNVSHIKTGRTHGIDEKEIVESLSEVRDKALDRLMVSLGLITDEKLAKCNAKELSVVAANMGKVVEKTIPRDSVDRINLVIYTPELKQERAFDVVDI